MSALESKYCLCNSTAPKTLKPVSDAAKNLLLSYFNGSKYIFNFKCLRPVGLYFCEKYLNATFNFETPNFNSF